MLEMALKSDPPPQKKKKKKEDKYESRITH